MQQIFRFFLASGRKRRCRSAAVALWLLRLLRDAENEEMWRLSDLPGSIDAEVPRRKYVAAEDDYLNCEPALDQLESAIENLEYAY